MTSRLLRLLDVQYGRWRVAAEYMTGLPVATILGIRQYGAVASHYRSSWKVQIVWGARSVTVTVSDWIADGIDQLLAEEANR